MLIVGLTGGMCCGKTSVGTMFAELDCYVIDADQISRKLVDPDSPAWKRIAKFFGPEILNKDRTIHRKKLASIIYADKDKRKFLNSVLHPLIIKEEEKMVKEATKNGNLITIVSAALMIEAKTYKRYPKIIVVYCTREIQIQRIMKRENISAKEAQQRIDAQLSSREKKKYGDYVINTSGPFPQTRKQVVQVYQKLKRLAMK